MANNSRLFSERNLQPWLIGRAGGCIKVGDGGGAGFCRFPAWVKVKSNDVNLGHAIVKAGLSTPSHLSRPSTLLQVRYPDYRGNRVTGQDR